MSRAVLSMGSNQGDPRRLLSGAVHALGRQVRTVSSLYRTPPWGPVPQDDYLNVVVLVEDDHLDAHGWLRRAHELEQLAGRERAVRWGPRTLDVDVVAVQDHGHEVVLDDPELTLPHPRAAERAFVLVPWAEIDPTAELPGHGAIADLLDGLDTSAIDRVGHVH
ncbi:2-amino-4-hydroxy-6-hydroxymethyldihydropteridine diphosphokinase [Nakamurella leprariae]|uniref:2-amino-4-hydroxy-6-hydroxymethyldihydropteridine diphosphokinase n=1 Tax=Nakamurella leprariae TaxID=2803911 RepID=A0A938YAP6_9ACTN|nr:2-amino-4-hydroxy-6-hydroxymethyldihydropteridine diphosphokinase [Nakamurella leprariae]MBM9466309.1 2-amino-4-hydroxy-6-hydroxymethyldihydropteridine diphosphokinase [Nakamurella leprariae]